MTTTAERCALPGTSVSALFEGWQAGFYDLPAALTDAARAHGPLVLAAHDARVAETAARPDRRRSLAGRDEYEEAVDDRKQATRRVDASLAGIEGIVSLLGDQLVTDYLRPAHDATLAAVLDVLPDLEGIDLADFAAIARAGSGASAGFLVVVAASERLAAIDAARECVFARVRLGSAWRDTSRDARLDGALRDTRRWPDLGRVATISKLGKVRVGPVNPFTRTAWLADPANGAWCPTADEWQAEFDRWMADPARNGRVTGRVPMVRNAYISRGARR